jgi:tetratricopeptide (TPR) repeat protein
MSATWQIENDEPDEAIETLRLALDREPDDAEAMTIMARAHERSGETQLAQDLLALAVEASRNAPEESLRFARVQLAEEHFFSAEEVLINALRRSPDQPELLATLGQVYLATADWSRVQQVIDTLRRFDAETARTAANDLQLQLISRREGRDQGISFLEDLVRNGSGQTAATVALIQAHLQDNRGEDALAMATGLAKDNPDVPQVGVILGNTQLALGRMDAAEATFRDVLSRDSTNTNAILQLVRVLSVQGRTDEAQSLLETSLSAAPENPDLLWAKASFREQANDIDGAIEIYETLYAMNTDNQVVANNLASLLVTYRPDEKSLKRAVAVGKRLRGTDFPPFQDTYGWLLYRQGVYGEAVTYLEPAARALNTDPIVQFHLGKAYLALERNEDALKKFEAALELTDENDPRPQIAEAKSEIERLSSASE